MLASDFWFMNLYLRTSVAVNWTGEHTLSSLVRSLSSIQEKVWILPTFECDR